MTNSFFTIRRLATFVLLCPFAILFAGCGQAFNGTAPSTDSFSSQRTISGQLHGGNQPITSAAVLLYAAGTTGYGSAATLYATTSTDSYGNFSFTQTTPATPPTGPISPSTNTYACPTGSTTNANPQMYLVARGGNTQGAGNGTNSAAVFAVAIGLCDSGSSVVVNLNEVTSTATMAALQQYFNPVTESFGYPSTTQAELGFANGVNTLANLVSLPSGTAIGPTSYSATPLGATNSVTVTVTPEQDKINLVANILASCVNTTSNTSTTCNTLFTNALPPTAAFTSQPSQTFTSITPTNEDTLQALYFMMTDPTSGGAATGSGTNINNLFNLAATSPPFLPDYSAAPTDWTIAINYTSTSTCTLAAGAGTTSTNEFLHGVDNPNVDAMGNIWWATDATAGGLYQISPTGVPLSCGLGKTAGIAEGLTIDSAGYIWVASGTAVSSVYNLYKWNPSSGTLDSTWPGGANSPEAITADGNGNIFYTATASDATFSTTTGSVDELEGAGVAGASPGALTTNQIATVFSSPLFMQVDSSDRVWVAITNVTGATSQAFFDVFPSNSTTATNYLAASAPFTVGGTVYSGFQSANVGDTYTYSPYGVAVGATTVDIGNGAGSGSSGYSYDWEFFTPGATAGTVTTTHTGRSAGGLLSPRGLAVDGANNVFSGDELVATGNYVTGASTGLYTVAEVSSTGAPIAATSTPAYDDNSGGFQKAANMLPTDPRGFAVDPTGNLWVGENSSSSTSVMELVGIGVPAVTPLSVSAGNGTLGTMP